MTDNTDKFQYPIFPDRVYTIKESDSDKEIKVYGDVLIAAYLTYTESLIPSQTSDDDYMERLF